MSPCTAVQPWHRQRRDGCCGLPEKTISQLWSVAHRKSIFRKESTCLYLVTVTSLFSFGQEYSLLVVVGLTPASENWLLWGLPIRWYIISSGEHCQGWSIWPVWWLRNERYWEQSDANRGLLILQLSTASCLLLLLQIPQAFFCEWKYVENRGRLHHGAIFLLVPVSEHSA
jgi:hypothetical protein